jgi:hypothetical protein
MIQNALKRLRARAPHGPTNRFTAVGSDFDVSAGVRINRIYVIEMNMNFGNRIPVFSLNFRQRFVAPCYVPVTR